VFCGSAASLAAFLACSSSSDGGGGGGTDDGSVPSADGSTPGKDSGTIVPGKDSGTSGTDSGTPGTDSGPPSQDAGPPGPRYVGRTLVNGAGVACDWSGCRAIAKFHGTAASISIGGAQLGSSVYDVIVDGTVKPTPITVTPANATSPFVLASGLAVGDHTVEIYKRSEAQDGIEVFQGFTFPNGGTVLSPPLPGKHLIEFVGDSVTAGFGALGNAAGCEFQPTIDTLTTARQSFAGVTASNLSSDAFIIAFSGKGVTRNYCQVVDMAQCGAADPILLFGNADATQDLYGMTTVADGAQTWGFKPVPDAVVIALGADDFNNAGNGTQPTQVQFQAGYSAILTKVRSRYPSAYIFATYSPSSFDPGLTIMQAAIPAAVTAKADAKMFYVNNIPDANVAVDATGCLNHPNVAYHAKVGAALTTFIKGKTGW
jgi:hypothetical protein